MCFCWEWRSKDCRLDTFAASDVHLASKISQLSTFRYIARYLFFQFLENRTRSRIFEMVVHDHKSESKKASISTRIISGTIGAIVTSLVVTPFEVVKVRTQIATTNNGTSSKSTPPPPKRNVVRCPKGCGTFVLYNGHMDCVLAKSSVPYFDKITGKLLKTGVVKSAPNYHGELGTLAMLRRIYAQEGLHGIYAGLRPTLIMAAPNTIFYYAAYEEIVWRMRQSLHRNSHVSESVLYSLLNQHETWLFPFLAGGAARLCSSTLTAPLEFLRTRQASAIGNAGLRDRHATGVATQRSGSLFHEFRTIVRNEGGIRTLYRGLRPTLWRDVPFSSIYWLLLEQFRLGWDQIRPASKLSPLEEAGETFISGAAAGLIAAACTTPFDVAKTRQQTWVLSGHLKPAVVSPSPSLSVATFMCKHDGACVAEMHSPSIVSVQSSPHGTFQELRRIAQTEGLAGLWRGNQARMLKVAPSCAIMLSSYELGKRLLE
jgi:solute carrier family 25, member 39/40